MKSIAIITVSLVFGVLIGGYGAWLQTYGKHSDVTDQQEWLESVLKFSNIEISDENYACEGRSVKTVGAVMASLIEFNNLYIRNKLSYGCYNLVCSISVSSCKPWQESECGSRFLKFNTNNMGEIEPSTFSCLDLP